MCPSNRTQTSLTAAAATSDFRPAFEVIDSDQDGKISYNDLQNFFLSAAAGELQQQDSRDEDFIGTMMSVADSNCDGFVEYDEFENVLEGSRRSSRVVVGDNGSVMEDVFRIMDKDGDGKLSHDDLKAFMAVAGLGGGDNSDEDVAAMIKLGGGDAHSGGVSYQGLLNILSVAM